MDVVTYLLGKKASGGGGIDINEYFQTSEFPTSISNFYKYIKKIPSLDTSNVTSMLNMFKGFEALTTIPLFDTSKVTNMQYIFNGCYALTTIPLFDTSSVTNMSNMFNGCHALTTIPLLNTSKVTNMQSMFQSCYVLTNDSLDNILQMCINATSYSGTKTLYYLGINSSYYSVATIQSLPHYQDFLDAGWTIGY